METSGGTSTLRQDLTQLHRRTQIVRFRRLAWVALAAYDLPPARLQLLAHRYNTLFRVDTDGGQRYVLRIHRAHAHTVAAVESELLWLAALRRDTTLEVPAPVATRAGALLTVAEAPGLPRPYICVLFRWLPGRRIILGLAPSHLERAGALMARLHNHALGWQRPPGFLRGRVDSPLASARLLPDPFAPEVLASIKALLERSFTPDKVAWMMAGLAEAQSVEQELGYQPPVFNLIHADLHYRNLLFSRDTVRAIDFDDSGFGPLLYDLAVMLSEVLDWAAYPALRAALLKGYRRIRELPLEHEAYLDTFIRLRRVQDALWHLA